MTYCLSDPTWQWKLLDATREFERQINSIQTFDLNKDGKGESLSERFDRDHDGVQDTLRVVSGNIEVLARQEGGQIIVRADLDDDHVVDVKFEGDVNVGSPQSEEELIGLLERVREHYEQQHPDQFDDQQGFNTDDNSGL